MWLQRIVDGSWTSSSALVSDRIVVIGDDETLRLAPADLSRHLVFETESFHDALVTLETSHETVPVYAESAGREIDIDKNIAELIQPIWAVGSWTTNCCEDQDGRVVITFDAIDSAERFVNAVIRQIRPARAEDVEAESLYNRIVRELEPDDWQAFRERRTWSWEGGFAHDYGGVNPDDKAAGFAGEPGALAPSPCACHRPTCRR